METNILEFNIIFYHPIATNEIIRRWIDLFIPYKGKYENNCLYYRLDTSMNFEECVSFLYSFTEFKNTTIYTLYTTPITLDLLNDTFIYNNESFYLQDLNIRNENTIDRINKLKEIWIKN
jgi:hypothetical protein